MADDSIVELKASVQKFWDAASCGEIYATGASARARYAAQSRARYNLEPYIAEFADFPSGSGRDILEIGVGMGADHVEWACRQPRTLCGIDLTPRAIAHTNARFTLDGLESRLAVADAERLPFADESYDLVYSWGVLHHSPDTRRAIAEVHRVLRKGGRARIMIYHSRSIVGAILWLRYALLSGRLQRSLAQIYSNCLESPGTKAYSIEEARDLFAIFARCRIRTQLSFGDL
ncbi:MAG TPA: class I SAM-dependent methyltransferase, partial [Gemmatimonadales bacterium]|nr:class I SAM-dependent methyltransferase [Gemmatimonadales bacterium]